MPDIKVTENHKALARFIKSEHGVGVKPESVALVLTASRDFRNSPERREALDARKAAVEQKKAEQVARAKALYLKALQRAGLSEDDVQPTKAVEVEEPAEAEEVPWDEEETEEEPAKPAAKKAAPRKRAAAKKAAAPVIITEPEVLDEGDEFADGDDDGWGDDEDAEDF